MITLNPTSGCEKDFIDTYDLHRRPVRLPSAEHPVKTGCAGVGADGYPHLRQQYGGCTGRQLHHMAAYHHVAGISPTAVTGDIGVPLCKSCMATGHIGTKITVLKQSEADAVAATWQAMNLLLREAVVGTAGHATVWANAVFGATAENGRNGVIIFPDNYTQLTSSVAPVNINTAKAAYDANTYSYDAWKATEAAGSVFLPAGGAYTGATPLNHEAGGYYWSSTKSPTTNNAYAVYFKADDLVPKSNPDRHYRYSVRLVKDVQ